MTIEEILAGESKNIEFKETLPEKSIKYMKSVVAFANGTRGKIIFGIADKTREVIGFDKEDVFKKMDAIANAVLDSCEPAIIPDITLQTVEGKTVIVVEVSEGRQQLRSWGILIERQVGGTVDLNDLNNAIKVPNTIDKMPDSDNKVPDKAEIVPNTMKKIPDSSDGMPDKTEKMPDNEQEQQIYKYVSENGPITAAETAELLEVKPRRARAVLLNMVRESYLKKEGAARSTIYEKNTKRR